MVTEKAKHGRVAIIKYTKLSKASLIRKFELLKAGYIVFIKLAFQTPTIFHKPVHQTGFRHLEAIKDSRDIFSWTEPHFGSLVRPRDWRPKRCLASSISFISDPLESFDVIKVNSFMLLPDKSSSST